MTFRRTSSRAAAIAVATLLVFAVQVAATDIIGPGPQPVPIGDDTVVDNGQVSIIIQHREDGTDRSITVGEDTVSIITQNHPAGRDTTITAGGGKVAISTQNYDGGMARTIETPGGSVSIITQH